MMSWVRVTLGVEVFLPSTEAGQSGVGVVNDLQPFLQHNDGSDISFPKQHSEIIHNRPTSLEQILVLRASAAISFISF